MARLIGGEVDIGGAFPGGAPPGRNVVEHQTRIALGDSEMNKPERSAFTLVELLVVVVIIAMLAGLLLPAVVRGRESARRAQCTNNQHELALALQQYENAKGQLPGYIDSFGGVQNLSWVTMVLTELGHPDLWKKWRDPNVPMANKYDPSSNDFARVDLPEAKCPSDSTVGNAELSYVVNCGLPDAFQADPDPQRNLQLHLASGLFFDRRSSSTTTSVRTDRIRDGAANTLLFSENIQATSWAPPLAGNPLQWPPPGEAHVGMVWGVPAWGSTCPINLDLDATQNPNAPDIQYARPSSHHPGGVVVTFADGRQQFLNQDETDYETYKRLMAPHDEPLVSAGLIP